MRNYPCRQPLASSSLLPASCSPHQTLRFLLYALGFQLSTHASNSPLLASCFRLPASCALCLYSLLSAPSALSHLLPASCFLRTLPLPFTLYSLLTASALSALCPQLSAFRSLPFNIGTLRKMVFREVVSVGSEPQLFHTPKKTRAECDLTSHPHAICLLPACLLYARDLAFVSELTEADTANAIFSQICMWTSTDSAAAVFSCGEFLFALLFDFHCCFSHSNSPPYLAKGILN